MMIDDGVYPGYEPNSNIPVLPLGMAECVECKELFNLGPNQHLFCSDCLKDTAKCEACGVPLIEHLGHSGTCAELQRLKKAIRVIRSLAVLVDDGDILEVCDMVMKKEGRE